MIATLLLDDAALSVSRTSLTNTCALFTANPTLADSPYRVRSSVPLDLLRLFLSAVEGTAAEITADNCGGLWQLSGEFGFGCLAERLSSFCGWGNFAWGKSRLCELEARVSAHDRGLARLQSARPDPAPAAVLRRLEAVERELSDLKYGRREFKSAANDKVFKVAVVGFADDSERLLSLIEFCERYECAVDFEFLLADGSLPPSTDGVLLCCPSRAFGGAPAVVRVGFAGDCVAGADVVVGFRRVRVLILRSRRLFRVARAAMISSLWITAPCE
jgi:hypothetical protein